MERAPKGDRARKPAGSDFSDGGYGIIQPASFSGVGQLQPNWEPLGVPDLATWPLPDKTLKLPPGCSIEGQDDTEEEDVSPAHIGPMAGLDLGPADMNSWKTASFNNSFRNPMEEISAMEAAGHGDVPPPGAFWGAPPPMYYQMGAPPPWGAVGQAPMPQYFSGSAAQLEAQAAELDARAMQLKLAAAQAELAAQHARSSVSTTSPMMGPSMMPWHGGPDHAFAGMAAAAFAGRGAHPVMIPEPQWGPQSKDTTGNPNKVKNTHLSLAAQKLAKAKRAPGTAPNKSASSTATASNTTVMLRNIPNNYNREMVLELLNDEGFTGKYDFVYLPMDFHRMAGLGYAFVNLVSHEVGEQVKAHFEGFTNWKLASQKVCEVSWGEPLQGLEAHMERYRNSPVMHEDVPDKYKPVLYHEGQRIDFPAPSKRIRPPRVKKSMAAAGKGDAGGGDAGGDAGGGDGGADD